MWHPVQLREDETSDIKVDSFIKVRVHWNAFTRALLPSERAQRCTRKTITKLMLDTMFVTNGVNTMRCVGRALVYGNLLAETI